MDASICSATAPSRAQPLAIELSVFAAIAAVVEGQRTKKRARSTCQLSVTFVLRASDRALTANGDLSAERCEFAPDLSAVSASSPPGSIFPNVLTGVFGETNDYNPYRDADPQLPPACSTVYDAAGAEVVYALTLAPGETLDVEYQVEPFDRPPALYLLDDCGASPTWPDFDLSGACGNNEYAAIPFCVAGCGPLTQSFTYPEVIGGQTTTAKTFFLVLDTLDQTGISFELRWGLR